MSVFSAVAASVVLRAGDADRIDDPAADEHDGTGTRSLQEVTSVHMPAHVTRDVAVSAGNVIAFAHGKEPREIGEMVVASPRLRPERTLVVPVQRAVSPVLASRW